MLSWVGCNLFEMQLLNQRSVTEYCHCNFVGWRDKVTSLYYIRTHTHKLLKHSSAEADLPMFYECLSSHLESLIKASLPMIQEAGRKRRDAASPCPSSSSSCASGCGTWSPLITASISHLKGGGDRSDGYRMEELTSCWNPLTELDPSEAHTHSCSDSPGSWHLTDPAMTHVALEVKQVRKKLVFLFCGCQLSMTTIRGETVCLFLIYFLKCLLHGCKISLNQHGDVRCCNKRKMSPKVSRY